MKFYGMVGILYSQESFFKFHLSSDIMKMPQLRAEPFGKKAQPAESNPQPQKFKKISIEMDPLPNSPVRGN
jgi:hypothetical protein